MSPAKDKLQKYSVDDLKDVASFFNLERSGDKAHLVDRISEFIQKPQDFGASKAAPKKKSAGAAKKKTTTKKLTGTKRKAPSSKKASKSRKGSVAQKEPEAEESQLASSPMEMEENTGEN